MLWRTTSGVAKQARTAVSCPAIAGCLKRMISRHRSRVNVTRYPRGVSADIRIRLRAMPVRSSPQSRSPCRESTQKEAIRALYHDCRNPDGLMTVRVRRKAQYSAPPLRLPGDGLSAVKRWLFELLMISVDQRSSAIWSMLRLRSKSATPRVPSSQTTPEVGSGMASMVTSPLV